MGTDSVAPFRRAPKNFPCSPKGATELCSALRKGLGQALKQTHCVAPFRRAPQNFSRSPKGAKELCSALRKGFSRIRKAKWRRGSRKNLYIFMHIAHTFFIVNIVYLRSSIFSRSFFWYQIEPISISWDAPFKHVPTETELNIENLSKLSCSECRDREG